LERHVALCARIPIVQRASEGIVQLRLVEFVEKLESKGVSHGTFVRKAINSWALNFLPEQHD
jgi:hypothetical protein